MGQVKLYRTTRTGLLEIVPKGAVVLVQMPPEYGKVKVTMVDNSLVTDYVMFEEIELITDEEEIICWFQKLCQNTTI